MEGVMVRPCSHKNKRFMILNNNSFVSVNDFWSALSFSFQTALFLLVKQGRISHEDQESLDSGTRHPFRSWSFITCEGEGGGVANLRNPRRFSIRSPIHPSFLGKVHLIWQGGGWRYRGGAAKIFRHPKGGLWKNCCARRGGSKNLYTSKPTHDIVTV